MLRMRAWAVCLGLGPALLVLAGVTLYPLYRVVQMSLTNYELTKPGKTMFVGAAQYITLLHDDRYLWALVRSLYFAGVTVVGTVVLGYLAACLLNSVRPRIAEWVQAIIILPMLISPLVAGAVFRYMYDYEYGLINYVIQRITDSKVAFLGDPVWALHAVIITEIWQWLPFAVVVIFAGMQRIPKELLEAASLDGANWWRYVKAIQLPLLKDVLMVVVLIRGIDAFREFDKIYILTSGGPGTASETLSMYLYRQAFGYFDLGYGSAMAISMILIISLLAQVFVRAASRLLREA